MTFKNKTLFRRRMSSFLIISYEGYGCRILPCSVLSAQLPVSSVQCPVFLHYKIIHTKAMDLVYIRTQLYLKEIGLFLVQVIRIYFCVQIRIDKGSEKRM